MRYTKTVFIRSTNQVSQFKALKVGQWVTGMELSGKSGLYRGQYLGLDNDGKPIINFRLDNVKSKLGWKKQFKSNASLREFARIKV